MDDVPLNSDDDFEIRTSTDLLVRIASLYYLNNKTQEAYPE